MVEKAQSSNGVDVAAAAEAASNETDKQSMLLKLAERTVLQAEGLAKEIEEHARQESEAEGARIVAKYTEQAKAEAQQTVEAAHAQSETILGNASAEAQSSTEKSLKQARSESEKILSKAQADSEKMLAKAQAESEKIVSKAQSDSEESLSKAQAESQEILARARQDALAIINSSQARANSAESKARLKAEFIIRQTTQNVADGIRSAVLETCNNLLATVEEFGKETSESPALEQLEPAVTANGILTENGSSHSDDQPSDSKTKSSAKKGIAA